MNKSTNIDLGVLIAIVFASVAISGSLVFFGMQSTGTGADLNDDALAAKIDEGIERYVQKMQAESESQQAQAAAQQAQQTKEKAQNVPPVSLSEDHIYGNKDARISLVEYSDFQCPFCQAFHSTAKQIVSAYSGDVNWVYRHYPLSFHDPAATRQAIASECVAELGGNEEFWEFGDVLFASGASDNEGLASAAADLGVDRTAFLECLESERYADKIKQDLADGTASGVSGTPGNILVNNETGEAILVEGAQPFSVFKEVIDGMLS